MVSNSSKKICECVSNFLSIKEFLDYVNIDYETLIKIVYETPMRENYREFQIPKKSGGKRNISSPNENLKNIQLAINEFLQQIYRPKAATQGFIRDRSILSNAKRHKYNKKDRVLYNLDIKDFFPSITYRRVRGLFCKVPYSFSKQIATLLAQICIYRNELPQGAPTSPTISNMICAKMDSQLTRIAKKYCCIYTRYADDISFSTTLSKFPEGMIDEVHSTITINGFEINNQKSRLTNTRKRQEITGLVINEFPNVPRNYIRNIPEAMLYEWEFLGIDKACRNHNEKKQHIEIEENFKDFRRVLHGKIEFLRFIRGDNDFIYKKYYLKAKNLEIRDNVDDEKRLFRKKVILDSDFNYSSYKDYYALVVGIDDYIDDQVQNLQCCVNDAEYLSNILNDAKYTVALQTTKDHQNYKELPTKYLIESRLKNLCNIAGEKDIILVYFACHGERYGDNAYLYMHDTHVNSLENQGLSINSIEELLNSSKAKVKILILDACHIGTGRSQGGIDKFREFNDLVEQAEGFALLSASTADQVAQENLDLQHGVFTYYLCEGLNQKSKLGINGIILINDLYDYVFKELKKYCGIKKEFQKPGKRLEGYGELPIIIR